MHVPGAPYGLFEGGPDVRVEPGKRLVQGLLRHPGGGQVDAVETDGVLADGFGTAALDIVADGPIRATAASTSVAARGRTPARVVRLRLPGAWPRRSIREITCLVYGEYAPPISTSGPAADSAARRPPYSASRMMTEVSPGQNASALLAPSSSDAWKKAPFRLVASRWL